MGFIMEIIWLYENFKGEIVIFEYWRFVFLKVVDWFKNGKKSEIVMIKWIKI